MRYANLKEAKMITLNLSPTEEARIVTVAHQTGLDPAEYVKKLIHEHLPPVPATPAQAVDDENDAAIALLQSWIDAAPTDLEEIREAEAERDEFMQNLNRNRIESGERPLFP